MSQAALTVPTLFKCRYRKVNKDALPRWCGSSGDFSFKQEAASLARQDSSMRFLLEIDRKLDTILSLLQSESIEEDFPLKGYVLEISASGLVLESGLPLHTGENLDLLLMMGGYPMRMLSVMGEVQGVKETSCLVDGACTPYAVSYECLSEEDRDAVIAFIFQEDRKRIRRQKEES